MTSRLSHVTAPMCLVPSALRRVLTKSQSHSIASIASIKANVITLIKMNFAVTSVVLTSELPMQRYNVMTDFTFVRISQLCLRFAEKRSDQFDENVNELSVRCIA